MGKFERDLDESLLRYGRRREKIEQLYEKEREASLQNQELEPREESIGKVQWVTIGVSLMLVVGLAFVFWPQVQIAWHTLAQEFEEDQNGSSVVRIVVGMVPIFAVILGLTALAAGARSTMAEPDEDGDAQYCDWEGGPYECQKDATVLMEGRKFDLGLCVRHAEELDRMAPGDYRRSKL